MSRTLDAVHSFMPVSCLCIFFRCFVRIPQRHIVPPTAPLARITAATPPPTFTQNNQNKQVKRSQTTPHFFTNTSQPFSIAASNLRHPPPVRALPIACVSSPTGLVGLDAAYPATTLAVTPRPAGSRAFFSGYWFVIFLSNRGGGDPSQEPGQKHFTETFFLFSQSPTPQ